MKRFRIPVLCLSIVALALSAGCSRKGSVASEDDLPLYDPSTATATVSGSIRFEGTPPVMEPLKPGGSRFCVMNARGLTSQDALVTKDGKLRNAIVYARSGYQGRSYSPPSEPKVLDQQRCLYVPHVLTMMTHQNLNVRNSDDTFHNIHALAHENKGFNFAQTQKGAENAVTFDHGEMPIHLGCDLHRWMGAWIGVFDHPFHATSGDTGDFQLKLPPGKYEIAAWHEKYGEQVKAIEVAANTKTELEFRFAEPAGK